MLTNEQKLQALRDLEARARAIYAEKLALINDIDRTGVAAEYGATSTKALLRDTLRITAASAARHVADAQAQYGDGAPLAAVADALEHGVVDADQVRVIRTTREALPDQIDRPMREHV